jgi:membrane protein implicated in regulation of membrane protease activity
MGHRTESAMPFSLYMIGFLVFMAGVVWAAVVVGVPQLYITFGALVLIAVGVIAAMVRSHSRRSEPRRPERWQDY